MLDEAAKRKANFDERNSAPVVLADGQAWHVPKPWLEIRPVFRWGRATAAYPVMTYGDELDGLVMAIGESEDAFDQITAVASLAAHLLCWHYELADGDLDQLLAFRRTDETSTGWLREVIAIATGRSGPKAFCAGGD